MYFRYYQKYQELYRMPVTAYSTNMLVYVNGYNLNQGLYPAINYRPFADRPYYTYVPIACFNKVGAVVNYDNVTNQINVTTDYFDLKNELNVCSINCDEIVKKIEIQKNITKKISLTDKIKMQIEYFGRLNIPIKIKDIEESLKYEDSSIIYLVQILALNQSQIRLYYNRSYEDSIPNFWKICPNYYFNISEGEEVVCSLSKPLLDYSVGDNIKCFFIKPYSDQFINDDIFGYIKNKNNDEWTELLMYKPKPLDPD